MQLRMPFTWLSVLISRLLSLHRTPRSYVNVEATNDAYGACRMVSEAPALPLPPMLPVQRRSHQFSAACVTCSFCTRLAHLPRICC